MPYWLESGNPLAVGIDLNKDANLVELFCKEFEKTTRFPIDDPAYILAPIDPIRLRVNAVSEVMEWLRPYLASAARASMDVQAGL